MTVLQALAEHYDRLAAKGKVPEFGYSREAVSYAVVLSRDGRAIDVKDLREMPGKKLRPSRRLVPRPVRRSMNIASNFLWDKTVYSLGVTVDRDRKTPIPARRGEHDDFRGFHLRLLGDTDDEGLKAIRVFLQKWQAESYAALPHADDMLNANIVFQLDGDTGFIHDRPAARNVWSRHLARQDGKEGRCLVTGQSLPLARLHPAIKGVRDARSSGASIVSFNIDAFESFRKRQGANAPVSERSAFAYTTVLNTLLAPDSGRRIQIGDATTVFWAEAPEAEVIVSSIFDSPPDDNTETVLVRDVLEKLSAGMPLAEAAPGVDEKTRYYVLGLAPNATRLSLRFWLEGAMSEFAVRFAEHWRDLRMDPPPRKRFPSVRDLVNETAAVVTRPDGSRKRRFDTIPPLLAGSLARVFLTGQRYPHALMATIVMRLRSDGDTSDLRATILKACIVRDLRLRNQLPQEDYLVSLDHNSDDPAYNLGRLFAAYAYAEKSFSERNATIRDKYMGAASATPRRVFPILMRGYEHNRAGLAKSDGHKRGAGKRADQAVGRIIERLRGADELPATLLLEDQARFFVGFYHQERDFYVKKGADRDQPNQSQE